MIFEFETADFDELTSVQQGWNTCYRPLTTNKLDMSMTSLRLDGLQIDIESYRTPIEVSGSAPTGGLSLVLPCLDSSAYVSHGREVRPGSVDIFGSGKEVMALARQHTRWVCATFSDKALKRLNELNLDSALQRFETNHQVLQCDPVNSRAIADHCMKLVEFFRKGVLQDGLNKNQRDDLLVSINSALAGPENKPTRNLLRQYKMVKQAREFMLDRKSDPPTIVDICDALSVPERTLHNAFQRVYGVSPKRFLTAQRLLAARRKLSESGATQTVSDVAASLGFLEFGRFSMVYKAMFGELPSETRV